MLVGELSNVPDNPSSHSLGVLLALGLIQRIISSMFEWSIGVLGACMRYRGMVSRSREEANDTPKLPGASAGTTLVALSDAPNIVT